MGQGVVKTTLLWEVWNDTKSNHSSIWKKTIIGTIFMLGNSIKVIGALESSCVGGWTYDKCMHFIQRL